MSDLHPWISLGNRPYFKGFSGARMLLPYGEHLLTPQARLWISRVFVTVFFVALFEAIVWAYIATVLWDGFGGVAAALLFGITAYWIGWIVHTGPIRVDRAAEEYDSRILHRPCPRVGHRIKHWLLVYGPSTFFFVVSLMITPHFVRLMLLHRDISQEINHRRSAIIADKVHSIESRYDHDIARTWLDLEKAHYAWTAEIAGTLPGGSGHYGSGEVADSIRSWIESLERRLSLLEMQKDIEIKEISQAYTEANERLLESRWGIVLPGYGFYDRFHVLQQFETTSMEVADTTAKGLLLLLFLLPMVLHTRDEPVQIRIYYSERLQELWLRYRAGDFDRWLPETLRSLTRPSAMTPEFFADLMCEHYFAFSKNRRVQIKELLEIGRVPPRKAGGE